VAAVAALAQCLIEDLSTKLDEGIEVPSMQPWYVRENKWRSARYGMDAIIILDSHGNEQLVTDDLLALLGRLEPVAARLGCLDELMGVDTILKKGASYQRQLAVAAEHDGDLKPVVRSLVRELRDGL
jgi:carboxylate-amine ligase